jgi:outer membrane protein
MVVTTACAATTTKIGVLDTRKIMYESKAAKEARSIFLMDLEKKRGVLKTKEQEVRALDQEINKDGPKMEAAKLKVKRDKLAEEIKELQRLKTDLNDDLKKKDAELTQKILKEIESIVKAYSKKEKYTIILDRRVVIDFDKTIEITGDIIKLYDAKKK